MQITLTHIGSRAASGKAGFQAVADLYLKRITPYYRCKTEAFGNEAAFLSWLVRQRARTPAVLVLLDSRGRQLSSAEFATWLGARRDLGAQHIVFAIGPADGWSPSTLELAKEAARDQSGLLLSFGPMTLPHELARVVLAEQVYRACTILAGHPYHGGH